MIPSIHPSLIIISFLCGIFQDDIQVFLSNAIVLGQEKTHVNITSLDMMSDRHCILFENRVDVSI